MSVKFDFSCKDQDDLSWGMQPFIINNGNAEQRNASLINEMKFDMLELGSIGLQLQDLETLLAKEVKHVPVTNMELNITLATFGDLLAVVLGPNHQVSAAYQLFWMEWNGNE